ncbi:MAG: fructose 1,6-bisphosphatase [Proteobacteria bacterium]|jgi:fructose 1,6-bisphosphate aldolase/phosphatase|nr:fructose 1,6-bisphosphatase [Pseudomonadota bacterium]
MRTTLSVIKADIGSIGGRIKPSHQLLERIREFVINNGKGLVNDIYVRLGINRDIPVFLTSG